MKFSFLLYALKIKIQKAAKKSAEFKEHLKEKNFTLVIKTADGKRGRFFTFLNGDVISKKGDDTNANVSLIWKDADSAFKIMASGNNEETMKALQNGILKLEGDAQLALWFTGTIKMMMKA
ncbi:MAG: hypothetical protein CVV44_00965 [Spirochaetae bacterium HGW-Spirochaetae-1]|jgi:hypothetical protein|nr:MAG: hypothetical protein CVV44_00965 [Spirochaetae bacterium HGW-Spirochaetae-1]